jgi:hypothetical protein
MSTLAEAPQYLSESSVVQYRPDDSSSRSTTDQPTDSSLTERGHAALSARWMELVLKDLGDAVRLPRDWDTYGGVRVSTKSVEDALGFLARFLEPDSSPPWVIPLSDGGLQLEWHRGGLDIEVVFSPGRGREMCVADLSTGSEWELDPSSAAIEAVRPLVGRLRSDD